MRSLWLLSILAVAAPTFANPVSDGRGALSLAKARRERAEVAAMPCQDDYPAAVVEAVRLRKPLVLWVGMKCEAVPALRKELADAVHCHVPDYQGNNQPRVLVCDKHGNYHSVAREKIGADTGAKLKAKWAPVPPIGLREGPCCQECGNACQCPVCQCGKAGPIVPVSR